MVDLDINPIVAPACEHRLPGIGGNLRRSDVIRDIDSGMKFPEVLRDDAFGWPGEPDEVLAAPCRVRRRPFGIGESCGLADILCPHRRDEEILRQPGVDGQAVHRAQSRDVYPKGLRQELRRGPGRRRLDAENRAAPGRGRAVPGQAPTHAWPLWESPMTSPCAKRAPV